MYDCPLCLKNPSLEGFKVVKNCQSCSTPIEKPSPKSRFCSDRCRKRYARSHDKNGIQIETKVVGEKPAKLSKKASNDAQKLGEVFAKAVLLGDLGDSDPSQLLYPTIRKSLSDAGVLDSYSSQIALKLAARIDNAHVDTGSAYAALCRELSVRLEAALAVAKPFVTPLDELKAKRDQRLRSGAH